MPTSFSSLACIDLTTQDEALIQEQCKADGFLLVDGAENLQLPTRHSIHYSVLTTRTVYCTCSRCLPSWNILNFSLNFNFETLLRRSHRLWMAPLPAQQTDLTSVQQKPLPCTRRPCPCRSCQAEAACTNAERETPALCVPLPGDSLQFMASSPNPLDATEGFNARIAGGIAKEQCEFWGRGRAPESCACIGDSEKRPRLCLDVVKRDTKSHITHCSTL